MSLVLDFASLHYAIKNGWNLTTGKIRKRNPILGIFFGIFKTQTQWKAEDIDDEGEGGMVRKMIKEVLQK